MSGEREKKYIYSDRKVKVKRTARNPEVTSRCQWRRLPRDRCARRWRRPLPVRRGGEARCGREGSDEEEEKARFALTPRAPGILCGAASKARFRRLLRRRVLRQALSKSAAHCRSSASPVPYLPLTLYVASVDLLFRRLFTVPCSSDVRRVCVTTRASNPSSPPESHVGTHLSHPPIRANCRQKVIGTLEALPVR